MPGNLGKKSMKAVIRVSCLVFREKHKGRDLCFVKNLTGGVAGAGDVAAHAAP